MLYTAWNGTYYNVGLATSTDGFHWTKNSTNPVLQRGGPGSWDQTGVIGVGLAVRNGLIYLFYTNLHPGSAVGFATSPDGITWTKYSGNPVFPSGPPGSWDAQISLGSTIFQDNQFHFWYNGYKSGSWQVGYATSPLAPEEPQQTSSKMGPLGFSLLQSYPNPFNPDATIEFGLPFETHVTLKIFDSLGREVTTLLDEPRSAGVHSVVWTAKQMAGGVYWCRMVAGNYSTTTKLLLLR